MKKIITLSAGIVFFANVFSQSWSPPGAKWIYSYVNGGSPATGYIEMIYSGDTVINSVNCQKLDKWYHLYDQSTFQFYNYLSGTEYTYEQNGVVHLFYNNSFDTLYHFNAIPGQRWWMAKHSNQPAYCDTNSTLLVLDTGTVVINSTPLKYQVVQFAFPVSIFPVPYQDTIIEKIGFVNSYFLPFDYCTALADGNEGSGFRCYSDSSFVTYQPHYPNSCDFITGENEIHVEAGIDISPNPATNELRIESSTLKIENIEIYDVPGQRVYSGRTTNSKQQTIDVSKLSSGIYFVKVKAKEGERVAKFVKE